MGTVEGSDGEGSDGYWYDREGVLRDGRWRGGVSDETDTLEEHEPSASERLKSKYNLSRLAGSV